MNVLRSLCVGAAALLIAGCNTVYTTKPMGDQPVAVRAQDWEGTWFGEDGAGTITVTDEDEGTLLMGWIEQEDDRLELKSHEIQLRRSGEWIFGSLKASDDPERWVWARVKRDKDQIIVWAPDPSRFGALVEEGVLPGTVQDDGDVALGVLEARHLKLITSSSRGVLLEWEEPGVLHRLRK